MAIKINGTTVIDDDKIFIVGSGTTLERPETPVLGMIWYNTDIESFEGYDGVEWGSIGGGNEWVFLTNTDTGYVADTNQNLYIDSSAGVLTVTLPPTPDEGDVIEFFNKGGWSTNAVTVDRNGSTIEGNATNYSLSIDGVAVKFVYDGATWKVLTTILSNYPFVEQSDIGTDPNQVPLNLHLGSMAYQNSEGVSVGNLSVSSSVTEGVYTITDSASVDLDPANGTIQLWTLGANRTPTAANFQNGQSMTLMINDGSARTITWSTIGVNWVGGSAPSLPTTGYAVVILWKVAGVIRGSYAGGAA